jgi:KDO2-lipid IV(A) lauroyltransferase
MKRIKNFLIFHAARALIAAVSVLPLAVTAPILGLIGRLAFALPLRINRVAEENIASVFPGSTRSWRRSVLRRCYSYLLVSAGEAARYSHEPSGAARACSFAPGARETFDRVLSEGKGAVCITGHIGNWELMAGFVARQGYPVYTIARESYDPRFTELIRRRRLNWGVNCIWRRDPSIKEKILGALMSGGLVGFLIDQDTRVPGVFAPFLGKTGFTPSLPAKIVASAGIPVLAVFIHRGAGGRHAIKAQRLDASVPPGADPVAHLTTVFNDAISREVLAHPHEWVWMHERWRTAEWTKKPE